MRLQTTCEHEIWSGFFGINANGDQPECQTEITIDVEDDCIVREEDTIRPSFSVDCPGCGATLDWPQEWITAPPEEG
jgi:hypothetical protein